MNCVTPRLHCSQIPTLLTLEQETEGISDNAVQEQTNQSHNYTRHRHSAAATRAPPAETASPPPQSIKSHQHKINSIAFASYWRNSIDFNGAGVTPILCWCICISVTEVTPAWLMKTTAGQPTPLWLKWTPKPRENADLYITKAGPLELIFAKQKSGSFVILLTPKKQRLRRQRGQSTQLGSQYSVIRAVKWLLKCSGAIITPKEKREVCSQEHHQGEGKSNVRHHVPYWNANSSQSESVSSNWKKRLWN